MRQSEYINSSRNSVTSIPKIFSWKASEKLFLQCQILLYSTYGIS